MFRRKAQITVLLLAGLALAGPSACRRSADAGGEAQPPGEGAYSAPPEVTGAARAPGGGERLEGTAPADSRVRLGQPGGEAFTAKADPAGRWILVLPPAAQARIFGLSVLIEDRAVQAEGYVLVGPDGEAALLRAGASAVRLDAPTGPGIATLDIDAAGGGLLSGFAEPGSDVAIRIDGRGGSEARSDEAGRFSFTMPRLAGGPHRLEVAGVKLQQALAFDVAAPAPLDQGPLRATATPAGLRADWLTPGGGAQTTILARSWRMP